VLLEALDAEELGADRVFEELQDGDLSAGLDHGRSAVP
jgi:hypothetical protein